MSPDPAPREEASALEQSLDALTNAIMWVPVDHDEARKIAEADDPWIYTDPVGKLAAAYLDLRKKAEAFIASSYTDYEDFEGPDEEWELEVKKSWEALATLRSCLKGSSDVS